MPSSIASFTQVSSGSFTFVKGNKADDIGANLATDWWHCALIIVPIQ
jgi:hypothetical protein